MRVPNFSYTNSTYIAARHKNKPNTISVGNKKIRIIIVIIRIRMIIKLTMIIIMLKMVTIIVQKIRNHHLQKFWIFLVIFII